MRGHSSLLIGRPNGLYDFFDNRLVQIVPYSIKTLLVSKTQPSRIAVATETDVILIEFRNGEWSEIARLTRVENQGPSDLLETANGRLIVSYSDGSTAVYAADQWLGEAFESDQSPIARQTFPRRIPPGFSPRLAGFEDDIHLFLPGTPSLWNPRTETFETDVDLAMELKSAQERWYAAARSEESLWVQSNSGSFSYIAKDAQWVLRDLPIRTKGTVNHSGVLIDADNTRVLFATPNGIVALPATIERDSVSAGPESLFTLRKVIINGTDVYYGDRQLPDFSINSDTAELELDFAAMQWDLQCDDTVLVLDTDTHPAYSSAWPVDEMCHTKIAGLNLRSGANQIRFEFRFGSDRRAAGPTLLLRVGSPWFTSPFLPLAVGLAVGAASLTGRLSGRRVWPESVRRYLALLSGLLICLALAWGTGLMAPGVSLTAVINQFGGLAAAALILPLVVEAQIRLGERNALKDRR